MGLGHRAVAVQRVEHRNAVGAAHHRFAVEAERDR
jgi:hypothetical protein